MSDVQPSKERRILRVMRQVLANVVKDVTPAPGEENPLSDATIDDIRELFRLIAEREAELAREEGVTARERPYFADEARRDNVVRLHPAAGRRPSPETPEGEDPAA